MEQLVATAKQKKELIKTKESQSEGKKAIKRSREIELFLINEENEKVNLLPPIGKRS